MKLKVLPGLLVFPLAAAIGLSPVRTEAAENENNGRNEDGRSIIVTGAATSIDELKEKLERMGIDCTIPQWVEALLECYPNGNRPGNPGNDENVPEVPEQPDTDENVPELPDVTPPVTPDVPDVPGTPEQPELPDVTPPTPDVPGTPEQPEAPDQPETPEQPEIPDENADVIRQVVDLVNEERAKAGLSPVSADVTVQSAAQVRAKEIKTSFSHTRPNGSSFSTALTEQGVSYRGSGENIAWGQKSAQQVMNGWMNSDGHRANILNEKFTKIGVGYYQDASGTNYWVQLFTY